MLILLAVSFYPVLFFVDNVRKVALLYLVLLHFQNFESLICLLGNINA